MIDVSNFLMNTNLSIANLKEFQILLQKFRYAIILNMFKFMLLPCDIYASNPNLKASDPHYGIPWAY